VAGGTDTHLILVDLTPIGLNGKAAEEALGLAGSPSIKTPSPLTCQPKTITSGIRLGTPAVTTRA